MQTCTCTTQVDHCSQWMPSMHNKVAVARSVPCSLVCPLRSARGLTLTSTASSRKKQHQGLHTLPAPFLAKLVVGDDSSKEGDALPIYYFG